MLEQLSFFTSIAFSFIAWGFVTSRYIWPRLRPLSQAEAIRPLLILHTFRFLGLAFLVPGVVSPNLAHSFASPAAAGDIIAATLAGLALLTRSTGVGVGVAWVFNIWGIADLLSAFYHAGRSGLVPGQLGAAFFIPTLIVPLLFITHGVMIRILLRPASQVAARHTTLEYDRLR